MKYKKWIPPLLILLFATVLSAAAGQLFLRNLFRFLSFDAAFSGIFRQISDAAMVSPLIALLLFSAGVTIPVRKLWSGKLPGRVLSILLCLLAVLLLFVLSVLFTRVNGVLFWDVVRTLIPLLMEGVL